MKTGISFSSKPSSYRAIAFLGALLLFSIVGVYGQENAKKFPTAADYLTTLHAQEKPGNQLSNARELQSLLTEKQATIYIEGNQIKTYGEQPRMLLLSLADFAQLGNSSLAKNHIELIQFTVNNPISWNPVQVLEWTKQYKNLKYIYFKVTNPVDQSLLAQQLSTLEWPYALFYTIVTLDHD